MSRISSATAQIIPTPNGMYIVKSVTPEGVTAYRGSDVPLEALDGLLKDLLQRKRMLARANAQYKQRSNSGLGSD